MKKFISLMLASMFLFCFSIASAQQPQQQAEYPTTDDGRWIYQEKALPLWLSERISKEDIAEATSRWHKIVKEDSAQQNEWTNGTYGIYGSTHMNVLRWSPANGYVKLFVNSCAMQIMSVEYGDALVMGEQLFFYPKKSSGASHGEGEMTNQNPAPSEYIRAKWRGVNFLVGEEDMKDFCDYAAGFNIRSDMDALPFYSKGDETGAPDQLPIVPKRFESLLRKSVNGKIISIGKRKIIKLEPEGVEPYFQSETSVVVNLGRADGLTDEMSVYILNENDCGQSEDFEITEIREKTSIGVIRRLLEEKPETPPARRKDDADYKPIKIGWKATTSQHIYYDHCQAHDSKNEQQ